MQQVFPRLAEQGADVFCVGAREAVASASAGVVLPDGVSEELSPRFWRSPFQQLALHPASLAGRIRRTARLAQGDRDTMSEQVIAAGTVVSGAEILRPGWLRIEGIGSRRLVVVSPEGAADLGRS